MEQHSVFIIKYVNQTARTLRWLLPQLGKILCFIGSLCLTLYLTCLPLLNNFRGYWPIWPLLWLFLVLSFLPNIILIIVTWVLGLMLDHIYGFYLGTHVLALLLDIYILKMLLSQETPILNKSIYETSIVLLLFIFHHCILFIVQRTTSIPTYFSLKDWCTSASVSTFLWFYCVDGIQFFSNKQSFDRPKVH